MEISSLKTDLRVKDDSIRQLIMHTKLYPRLDSTTPSMLSESGSQEIDNAIKIED